jgi:argininosuccinate lyase
VTRNSLDAVADRDFVVEVLAAAALAMVHLSRLAEELTWWSNPRFGFVRVADAFSTGSSMMPNKKNPDPAELVRGRAAGVIGALTAMLALLKGLPLAYQRDLQEDKPAFFAAVATLDGSLAVMGGLIETLAIDAERMRSAAEEGYTTATALADALVRRGVPFRAAHHIVGGLVGGAEAEGIATLEGLPDEAFRAALDGSDDETARSLARDRGIAAELRGAATIEGSLAGADVTGGTAPARVAAQLADAKARLRAG